MSKSTELIGGVQVSVETGTALVVGLDPRDRNVEVRLDDPQLRGKLRFPLKGWLDKADAGALALAERVKGTTEMVAYRIESHRDSKVDPTIPIADVPQTSRFRRLVALSPATDVSGIPDAASNGVPAGSERTRDEGGGGLPAAARPLADNPSTNRPGPRVAEAKPWEAANSDGSPNLGSYEFLAAVGMTELAHELMLSRAAEAGHQVFSLDNMRRLARTLLVAADRVQAGVRADGHADRMDTSHARARGAVRTALEAYPVPWEASATEKAAWVEDLVGWATEILRCAVELSQVPPVREMAPVTPDAGGLATEAERQLALAAARQVDDRDRDERGDTARDRLAKFMNAQGIPPLISRELTSEQAMKVRAYLANVDDAQGAAA